MFKVLYATAAILVVCLISGPASAAEPATGGSGGDAQQTTRPELTPDEHVVALEAKCATSADAQAARVAEKSLFDRLGGEEKIHALITEIVRLHLINEPIKHLLDGVDPERLAREVALFFISGTGGPNVYNGPTLKDSHARLNLTNADFLAAGGDVIKGMENSGYGQNEIDEVLCLFVGLRDQVVPAVTDESGATKQ